MNENMSPTPQPPVIAPESRAVVLLVDDQRIVCEAVRRMLKPEADIDFHYCAEGLKAIEEAVRVQATVVLQDLVMPDAQGLDVVAGFRSNPATAEIPVIVLSTKEEPAIKSQAFTVGANDYLVKLPDRVELVARVRYHSRAYVNQMLLRRQATRDALTGVWNRNAIFDLMRNEINRASRTASPLALIMADLDGFKQINDGFGHLGGDAVLREAAHRFQGAIRGYDSVGRYGGEEFLVIIPDCTEEDAFVIGEKLRAAIANEPFPLDQDSLRVTCSFGVCWSAHPNPSMQAELLSMADAALYRAKRSGRNCVKSSDRALDSTCINQRT